MAQNLQDLLKDMYYIVEHLDASDNLVDTDLSGEPAEVSAICNAVWTTDVKAAWKAKLIADKNKSS